MYNLLIGEYTVTITVSLVVLDLLSLLLTVIYYYRSV